MKTDNKSPVSIDELKKNSKEDLCLDRSVLRQRGGIRLKSALRAGEPPIDTGDIGLVTP